MGMFWIVDVHNVFMRRIQQETQHHFCCSYTETPNLNFSLTQGLNLINPWLFVLLHKQHGKG